MRKHRPTRRSCHARDSDSLFAKGQIKQVVVGETRRRLELGENIHDCKLLRIYHQREID